MGQNIIIIDIQGYQFKSLHFLCKELSIINQNNSIYHTFFELPIKFNSLSTSAQCQFRWLTNNIHGLNYSCRGLPYSLLSEVLNTHELIQSASLIVVKGAQKKKWLKYFLPHKNIINCEIWGCPKLLTLKYDFKCSDSYHCHQHLKNTLQCSRENVFLISRWIRKGLSNQAIVSSISPEIRHG